MGRLSGKTAIVTGAAEGIGVSYAKALAAEGANICLADVLPTGGIVDQINAARGNDGGRAIGAVCDVSDSRQVAAMVETTEKTFGGVHVLVNNAARYARLFQKSMMDLTTEEWDAALSVNVRGVFECVKAVVPAMRRQGYGKIVNVASGTVFKGTPNMLHYVASKGAVVAMTRSMANELGGDGIRVNCIALGLTLTDGIKARGSEADEVLARAIDTRFLKRTQTPDDLAGTVVFLASPDSDFITGQIIVVDGGSALH